MADIIHPREMWFFTLSENYPQPSFTVTDIATPVTLIPGETKDFLSLTDSTIPNNLNTTEIISASIQIRNYVSQGFLTSDYLHTHDDKSNSDHAHYGLNILTGGIGSSADSLHTHNIFVLESEFENRISQIVDAIDFSPYVRKDGSINQISDIQSTGDKIEEAVSKMHSESHSIQSHGTIATAENLNTLVNGSNADCLHTHSFSGVGITGVHNDLDGLNEGDYIHLTSSEYTEITNFFNSTDITGAEAETLTNGSNADLLHTHSGVGGVHNELDGLQGGDSVLSEYYHLDYAQYLYLTGGPSVSADDFHTHDFPSTAGEMPLGTNCDGDWTDGLFSWDTTTITACALDDINELLSSLAPPPSPALDNASVTTSGTTANLSFDSSNPIAEGTYYGVDGIGALAAVAVDGAFTDSGYRTGVIGLSTDVTGTLNDDVAAHAYSYPADSFGNADQGDLILELNGVEIRTIDLTTAGAVNDGTSATGFNITDHTANHFSNGDDFTQFQYRTGTWRVDSSNMRLGWNYMRVIHRISGVDTTTNYIDWVVDGNVVATSYSGIAFDNLVMTGSAYLSGVQYYTGGTAQYDVTVSNGQRNTWKSGNAITFTETNGTVSDQAFLNTSGNELQDRTLTNLTFTISGGIRLLNQNITVYTSVDRTINTYEANSSTSTISGILMDALIDHTTTDDATEDFDGEGYRMPSNVSITSLTNYASGPGHCPSVWDYTKTIANGGDAGYNDGLLVYNSRLQYPTQGLLSGDFRDNADGGTLIYAPSGNPTYTGCTGNRSFIRYFYSSSSRQNFTFAFTFSSTTFVSVATGPSANNVTVEILAPNTTVNGSSVVEWKDMVTAYTVDSGIGAYASTYGSNINTSSPNSWGVTIGSKSTATSANVIAIRITASSSWTGYISNIVCTFL